MAFQDYLMEYLNKDGIQQERICVFTNFPMYKVIKEKCKVVFHLL